MCRIVGGFELKSNGLLENIESMRDSMSAGGPDDCGLFIQNEVVLAHRRLSIIDLSNHAHQPFVNDRYALVFNGEIYNYKEVAQILQQYGIKCDSRSDTEVLLESFAYFGLSCVDYFDGMFAFTIFDRLEEKLYLCRDRFGVKPLYYYYDSNCFLFSSELKGLFAYPKLQKSVNKIASSYFLELGYVPAPYCMVENAYKLENGHYLVVDIKKARNFGIKDSINKIQYYSIKEKYGNNSFCEDSFEKALHKSISLRMVSDVNVGVCLSGGVDSSLVCAVLKEQGNSFETFSMSFLESSFDESVYAKSVADIFGVKNHKFICTLREAQDLIPSLVQIYDEPFGDTSALPTLLLAQKIRQTHKVALSADGGDELGFGYERYFWANNRYIEYRKFRSFGFLLNVLDTESSVKLLQKFGVSIGIDKFLRINNQLQAKSFLEHYLVEITHFRKEGLKKNGLTPFVVDSVLCDNFKEMSYFDIQNYLSEDILTKTDRASMSVGLEFREPLLGRELVEYMLSLKSEENLIFKDSVAVSGKKIFKKYLEKFLPKELIYRQKMGFGVPLESWVRGELSYLLDEIDCGYFNEGYVKSLIDDFKNNRRVDFAKIWYLYTFSVWKRYYKVS